MGIGGQSLTHGFAVRLMPDLFIEVFTGGSGNTADWSLASASAHDRLRAD